MRVLVTGNMGYVGSMLNTILLKYYPDIEIIGYDTSFFGHAIQGASVIPEHGMIKQYFGDVRDFDSSLFEGVDSVIHLAAISNDPMGNEFSEVTSEINYLESVRLAEMAAACGVKNFVFASSCSVYGQSDGAPKKETDTLNPLTAYARSKIDTEKAIQKINLQNMVFTSLRFATACGWSNRMRLDLVLNDFVACAISSGEISVLSDGTPWRPLIDVEDMARAIVWAIQRPAHNGGQYVAVNTGSQSGNYQVKEIAQAVVSQLPETVVSINKNAPPDTRSYSVDFGLFNILAPEFVPKINLDKSIDNIHKGLVNISFSDNNFRLSSFMRLIALRSHIEYGRLNDKLKWQIPK